MNNVESQVPQKQTKASQQVPLHVHKVAQPLKIPENFKYEINAIHSPAKQRGRSKFEHIRPRFQDETALILRVTPLMQSCSLTRRYLLTKTTARAPLLLSRTRKKRTITQSTLRSHTAPLTKRGTMLLHRGPCNATPPTRTKKKETGLKHSSPTRSQQHDPPQEQG